MCAVENANLALFIRGVILNDNYRKSCFFKGQFVFYKIGTFNYPEAEDLTRVNEVVSVTESLAECIRFASGITRNNTVNKS